jgi:2-phospho-L-lactate guanylyltransferase
MLRQVVNATFGSGMLSEAIVVSADPEALVFAQTLDPRIVPLLQTSAGLLPALDQARQAAAFNGFSTMMVLFGDLPLIDASDVRALLQPSAEVVIAPDQCGSGTNALVLRGAAMARFAFQFGVNSRALHLAEAERIGAPTATVRTPGVMFDLDTPDDWRRLAVALEWNPSEALLQEATPR